MQKNKQTENKSLIIPLSFRLATKQPTRLAELELWPP